MDCIRQLASSIACLSQGFKVPATTGVQRKDRRVKSAEVPTNVKEVVARFALFSPLMLDVCAQNPLSMKHFHEVLAGNVHERSLK